MDAPGAGEPNGQLVTKGRFKQTFDLVSADPYGHFVLSEIWVGLATVALHVVFRCVAVAVEYVDGHLPLTDTGPVQFLSSVIAWGGAISAAATFGIITLYQVFVLAHRLVERAKQ
ncbi:hypothetical protein [Mesorhizobium sp. CO1-1-9]|uniref:hypothetical protein n=1 Tax=Mesorhizobium sp. CO1-1-9 TaxID=2876630 RepID=UPI001CCCCAF1|nr:hypothetical protein [Mesorhizobium sp. CO1-1-9]MBZ9698822.1 hypothetical protein [Mesorhizobium sp. CO1-1-9]